MADNLIRFPEVFPEDVAKMMTPTVAEEAYYAGFDLAGYVFPVTTANATAQLWFNRAMLQLWNFNHEEAIACAKHALVVDRGCAITGPLRSRTASTTTSRP